MQNILANQKICPLKENNTGCPLIVSALDDIDCIQSSERQFSPQVRLGTYLGPKIDLDGLSQPLHPHFCSVCLFGNVEFK